MTVRASLLGLATLGCLVAAGGSAEAKKLVLPATTIRYQAPTVTVYLERGGAQLAAGADQAAYGRSSVLAGQGIDEVDVPAYSRSDAEWQETVACIRDRYRRWNLEIVDRRPDGADYTMAVIGGRARLLGFRGDVAGIAPEGQGSLIRGAVAYVFERSIHGGAQEVCEAAVHEIGHTLGLDHAYACSDPMSYLNGCGAKRFQDVDVPCGEFAARTCDTGAATQNSLRQLDAALGLAGETYPTPPPPPPDDDDYPPPDDDHGPGCHHGQPRGDSDGPDLSLLTPPRRRQDSRRPFVVAVRADDPSGVSRVELDWQQPNGTQVFRCDALPYDAPVSCQQQGDVYVFQLRVGRGERRFAVRAMDGYGNVSQSRAVDVRFR